MKKLILAIRNKNIIYILKTLNEIKNLKSHFESKSFCSSCGAVHAHLTKTKELKTTRGQQMEIHKKKKKKFGTAKQYKKVI